MSSEPLFQKIPGMNSNIAVVCLLLICCSCPQSEIRVGMNFEKAKAILNEYGAVNTPLSVEYKDGHSGWEGEIFGNRLIIITYNLNTDKITSISITKDISNGKGKRKWKKVDSLSKDSIHPFSNKAYLI